MKKYFDRIDRNWYEEKSLRQMYLEYETGDIRDNLEEYVMKLHDIDTQCNLLKLAINGDIEKVVERLNEYWNYDLVSEDKYYMEQYTYLSSKVGELEGQLEETKKKIKDVQENIHRLEKESK